MSEELVEERVTATFHFKRRRKPKHYYQSGVLRYYTPYIAYYRIVPREENLEKLTQGFKNKEERKELKMFPVRGLDLVVNYAKSLDAEISFKPRYLPMVNRTEKIPVIVFQDRYSVMRHLMFSLTYATVRSIEKVEKIREVVNGLNVSILEPFYNTAVLRYRELRENGDPTWTWRVLRIGRAFKTMYLIDRA